MSVTNRRFREFFLESVADLQQLQKTGTNFHRRKSDSPFALAYWFHFGQDFQIPVDEMLRRLIETFQMYVLGRPGTVPKRRLLRLHR